jgi:hypothetical protein
MGQAPRSIASSAKLTTSPEDLVATYGPVSDVKHHLADINVYWIKGLETRDHRLTEKGKADEDKENMQKGSIPVHALIAPLMQAVFDEIRESGDYRHILEKPWAYTPRENRNNASEWSVHSWGTAIDVNATTNPNGGKVPTEHQQKVQSHFTKHGFQWLEHSDAMHFQYHSLHAGTPKITDADIADIQAGKLGRNTDAKTLLHDVEHSIANVQKRMAGGKPGQHQQLEHVLARLEEMQKKLKGG